VACFATQGSGHRDEARIEELLGPLTPRTWAFDRGRKLRSALRILGRAGRERPDLIVMEGTGIGGGLAVLTADAALGVRFAVSSGDAVAPFVGIRHPLLRPLAGAYERTLYRRAAGVIGWTPYLAGRAIGLGARRAMTAAGWAPSTAAPEDGRAVRAALGIPADAIVFGLAGTLDWTTRVGYCYGLELVRAATRVDRPDVRVLIVGDGTGRSQLEAAAGDRLGRTVHITGAVPREAVASHLAAMDIASLPQSVDAVGALRYTTKLSEYLASRLPVVTGQIPLAYDLGDGWLWRLPGDTPWDDDYITALAEVMATTQVDEVRRRRDSVPADLPAFDRERQQRTVVAFIQDLVK
jgi:hypothetical protein